MKISAIPTHISVEHFRSDSSPLSVGVPRPRLSWRIEHAPLGFSQVAYELEATTDDSRTQTAVLESCQQVLVSWPFESLTSRQKVQVRVRVSDGSNWSNWSDPLRFETGLLSSDDWQASFISPIGIGGMDSPAPTVFTTVNLERPIRSARLYATAHGVYKVQVNGVPADDTVLAPGWTSYPHRLRYHAYNVTDLLHPGRNDLSATLGNGWYRGHLAWEGRRALYGSRLAFCGQLEIEYADGVTETISTDENWQARESHIVADDLYDGCTIDFTRDDRVVPPHPVEVIDSGTEHLVAPTGPSIRQTGTLAAQRIWTSPSGKTLVDFGQNAAGWVRIKARGLESGTTVTVRHAEVLENDELGTRPLRKAKATDTYTVADGAEVILEPEFTIHGFRYAQIEGIVAPAPEDIEMIIVGTDLERTGWFDCSDPMLNRLHENVVWSERANFIDIPTDCPQRDERLGWTGDINVFSPTALSLFDVSGLLASWLRDLAAEQYPDGGVPHVIPNPTFEVAIDPPTATWGDASVIVPWNVYLATGDINVLQAQFDSMRRWVDCVTGLLSDHGLWDKGFQFGDWLDPTAPPDRPGEAKTDNGVVATACFAHCAALLADAALVIGAMDSARQYRMLSDRVRASFIHAYVTEEGRIVSDSQTAYAMAMEWNLLNTDKQRQFAAQRLAELVQANGFHVATGFVGTPLICDALTHAGHADLAMRMLMQTECPSWLYPVTMGATTIWERWDSMLPDGTINPGEMTSFNHYSLGAVADWMHRTIAGLIPLEPAWRRIAIDPLPFTQLEHVSFRHISPYGPIEVSWRRQGADIEVSASIPVGVTAEVRFLSSEQMEISHGKYRWTYQPMDIARS